MTKHFTKLESEIINAVSVAELMQIKNELQATYLTNSQHNELMELIEQTLEDFN